MADKEEKGAEAEAQQQPLGKEETPDKLLIKDEPLSPSGSVEMGGGGDEVAGDPNSTQFFSFVASSEDSELPPMPNSPQQSVMEKPELGSGEGGEDEVDMTVNPLGSKTKHQDHSPQQDRQQREEDNSPLRDNSLQVKVGVVVEPNSTIVTGKQQQSILIPIRLRLEYPPELTFELSAVQLQRPPNNSSERREGSKSTSLEVNLEGGGSEEEDQLDGLYPDLPTVARLEAYDQFASEKKPPQVGAAVAAAVDSQLRFVGGCPVGLITSPHSELTSGLTEGEETSNNDHTHSPCPQQRNKQLGHQGGGHGGSGQYCHICFPLPEEAVGILRRGVGLTPTDARKAALLLLKYLRENQHKAGVQSLTRYSSGDDLSYVGSRRRPPPKHTANTSSPMQIRKVFGNFGKISEGGGDLGSASPHNPQFQQEQLSSATVAPQPHPQNSTTQRMTASCAEERLRSLLGALSRQRGAWDVFEREEIVLGKICDLCDCLTRLDRGVIRKVLREDGFESVRSLCLFFGLERRWAVRSECLSLIDLLSANDPSALAVLLSTDLPLDIAKGIRQEYLRDSEESGDRLLLYATTLLSLLKKELPLEPDQLQKLDEEFVFTLLELTEGRLKGGCSLELRDLAVFTTLAYNMQFPKKDLLDNKVVSALCGYNEADYLKQKMLSLMLNREVRDFGCRGHSSPSSWCHRVVKLATDILLKQSAIGEDYFMDADLHVMLAGLSNYVEELSAGDMRRTGALQLIRLCLQRLNYSYHNLKEILIGLKNIVNETDDQSATDKKIARKIARDIENWRHNSTAF